MALAELRHLPAVGIVTGTVLTIAATLWPLSATLTPGDPKATQSPSARSDPPSAPATADPFLDRMSKLEREQFKREIIAEMDSKVSWEKMGFAIGQLILGAGACVNVRRIAAYRRRHSPARRRKTR